MSIIHDEIRRILVEMFQLGLVDQSFRNHTSSENNGYHLAGTIIYMTRADITESQRTNESISMIRLKFSDRWHYVVLTALSPSNNKLINYFREHSRTNRSLKKVKPIVNIFLNCVYNLLLRQGAPICFLGNGDKTHELYADFLHRLCCMWIVKTIISRRKLRSCHSWKTKLFLVIYSIYDLSPILMTFAIQCKHFPMAIKTILFYSGVVWVLFSCSPSCTGAHFILKLHVLLI